MLEMFIFVLVVGGLVVIGILGLVLYLLSNKNKKTSLQMPSYSVRDDFLSYAEISFYHVLKSVVEDWAVVCPKVSLGDIFFARGDNYRKTLSLGGKIRQKHVDFLLCHPKTMKPLVGVELDDKSHQRPDRQARDAFVESVFSEASLRLVRIPVKHSYSVSELSEIFKAYIPQVEATTPAPIHTSNTPPSCPKCGSAMILRTAKSGANTGGKFWGCSQYPQCKTIINSQ